MVLNQYVKITMKKQEDEQGNKTDVNMYNLWKGSIKKLLRVADSAFPIVKYRNIKEAVSK